MSKIFQATFHETHTCSSPRLKNRLQRTLCSDSRNQLLFLSHENQHFFKKFVSSLAPGQATIIKMTAYWFSSCEVFVKLGTFQLTLRQQVPIFVKNKKSAFPFPDFKKLFKKDFVFWVQNQVALLTSWKPTGKNPISNVPVRRKYKIVTIPDPFRQKHNALLCRKFSISAQFHGMKFQNIKSFV